MILPPSARAALVAHRMRLKDELSEIDEVLKADSLEAPAIMLRPKPDRRKKKRRMPEETKEKIRKTRLKQERAKNKNK